MKVIVVGAGIGGLATAIRLLNKGYEVTIVEKEEKVGGKINERIINGVNFDLTGTILITPESYIDIFKEVGKDFRDYIKLEYLRTLYNVSYYDKSSYKIYKDKGDSFNELESLSLGAGEEYIKFIEKSLEKYKLAKENFLDEPMININELCNYHKLSNLFKIEPFKRADQYINSMISNEKLREYLLFKTMYIGINPYENSNLYTLIPAISQQYGFCYLKSGVYSYIKALEKLVIDLGGVIKTSEEVKKIVIKDKKVIAVKSKENIYNCDLVVCNADYPYAIKDLFDEEVGENGYNSKNIDKKDYSCSVFMLYILLKKHYKELNLHNIYINKNFKEGIEAPFNGEIPENPSLYIYYKNAVEKQGENQYSPLNVMVRVPNLSFKNIVWDEKTINSVKNSIMEALINIKGLEDIKENIIKLEWLTPKDLEKNFNAYYGNAFGISHKLSQSNFMRAHIKSKKIKGLYFIGSSTHPGNGISVILEGSRLVSELILAEKE